MTAEVELLPLPEASKMYDIPGYDEEELKDYARANVAVATATLQAEIQGLREQLRLATVDQVNAEAEANDARAEIEALRAEVADAREFCDKMANAIGNDQLRRFIEKHGEPVPLTLRMQAAEARAEKLEAEVERVTCELMDAITRADKLAEALAGIISRSSINLAMRSDPFELTAMLGDIHQIACAALAQEDDRE